MDMQSFDAFMRGLLECESLVVLTGLGSSLGLENVDGSGNRSSARAPTMLDLFQMVSGLSGFEHYRDIAPDAVESGDVESLLSAFQSQLGLKEDEALRGLLTEAEKLIATSCAFVTESTDLAHHELFLRKLVRRQDRLSRAQLFTTNYDSAFEAAADRSHIHVIDGFGVGRRGAFDGGNFDLDIVRRSERETPSLEPTVIHLLKLHGSVDWVERAGRVYHDPGGEAPVLIYPAATKYQMSFHPPYLECMSRWQVALRKPSVGLIVVGFGCNDAHIVGPLEAALRGNPGLRAVFVTPSIDTNPNPVIARIRRLVALGDKRVSTLAATFNQFVEYMPASAPTDAHERHALLVDDVWGTT